MTEMGSVSASSGWFSDCQLSGIVEDNPVKDGIVENASRDLSSDLNRPVSIFGIACCISLIALGATATILFVVTLSSGAAMSIPVALLVLFSAGMAMACVRIASVSIGDLSLPRPILQIDNAGILDRRLGCGLISWDNVERIISLDPQQAGCIVEVKTPVHAKFSRMRAGALGVIWRLPHSSVYVAMQQAMGPHVGAKEILSIAREHGVSTSSRRISKLTGRSIPA
jgi:hypothetical protein